MKHQHTCRQAGALVAAAAVLTQPAPSERLCAPKLCCLVVCVCTCRCIMSLLCCTLTPPPRTSLKFVSSAKRPCLVTPSQVPLRRASLPASRHGSSGQKCAGCVGLRIRRVRVSRVLRQRMLAWVYPQHRHSCFAHTARSHKHHTYSTIAGAQTLQTCPRTRLC